MFNPQQKPFVLPTYKDATAAVGIKPDPFGYPRSAYYGNELLDDVFSTMAVHTAELIERGIISNLPDAVKEYLRRSFDYINPATTPIDVHTYINTISEYLHPWLGIPEPSGKFVLEGGIAKLKEQFPPKGKGVVKPLTPAKLVGVELNPGPPGKSKAQKASVGVALSNMLKQTQKRNKKNPSQGVSANGIGKNPIAVAAAYSEGMTSRKPKITRSQGDDKVTIQHCELVTPVTGSTTFTATTIPMQPGLINSFPWLYTQTVGWEKYRFKKLKAIFITRTGTQTPGSIIMSPDYDASDPAPATEAIASTYHGTSDDAPWKTSVMEFDMRRSKELFIRTGPLGPNLDIKTYDYANLFVCTVDGTAVNWGKVYLDYEVELINSQLIPSILNVGGSIVGGGNSFSATEVFGSGSIVTAGSIVEGLTINYPGVNQIQLVNLSLGQEYQMFFIVAGTVITGSTAASTGISVKTVVANAVINAAATLVVDCFTFTASAQSATITWTVTATTVTGATLTVTPLVSNI